LVLMVIWVGGRASKHREHAFIFSFYAGKFSFHVRALRGQ
jgi:hypothetical protein